MDARAEIPEGFKRDVDQAVAMLRAAGCTEIFLFGSLADGRAADASDLDLAIRGCPRGSFFHLLGQLMLKLSHSVDLIDLDSADPFARYLEDHKELLRVG